jgi:prophage DNA circulation protein
VAFPVPPGVAGLLGLGEQTWQDRLREAAYTSPKGTRIKFLYADVGREFDLHTTEFTFPGVNNSYVQQNGHSSRRYPLRVMFAGGDHDLVATAFEAALREPGLAKLEHPLYGTVRVVPFGTVTRRDDLVTAANQTVIDVTFWTTTGAVYPSSGADAQSEILAAIAAFDVQMAQQFASSVDFLDTVKQAGAIATIRKFLRDVNAAMQGVSDAVTSVNQAFRDVQSLVNLGLDTLVGTPLLLAQQISNLIQLPGRALAGIEARLAAYQRLADSIFGSDAALPGKTLAGGTAVTQRTKKIANDFQISGLFALNAVAGSIVSVAADPLDNEGIPSNAPQFSTKTQALTAAEAVAAQFDAAKTWSEDGFTALEELDGAGNAQVDTGEAYQALQQAVALTQGFLVQVSFTLVPERAIVLTEATTILNLAGRLYQRTDDATLDFLISTNNLTGDEILEVPGGRRIVYYPSPS